MPYEFIDDTEQPQKPKGRYEFVDDTTPAPPKAAVPRAAIPRPAPAAAAKPVGALGAGMTWPFFPATRGADNTDASFMRDVVGQTGKDALKAAGNFIPSAAGTVTGLVAGLASIPKNIINQGGEALRSVADVGAVESGKNILNAAIFDPLKERYGSAEAIRRTAIEDPAGMLLDASAAMGGAGSAVGLAGKGAKMAGAGRAAEIAKALEGGAKGAAKNLAAAPITGPLKIAQKAMPSSWPTKLLASADKAPLSKNWVKSALSQEDGSRLVTKRHDIIKTQMKERIMPNEDGALKTNQLMNETGKKIGAIVDEHTAAGKTLDFGSALERARAKTYNLKDVTASKDVAAAREAVDKIIDGYKQHGDKITPRQMEDIKTTVYENFNKEGAEWGGHGPLVEKTLKAVAREARIELEGLDRRLKPLNARHGSLQALKPIIDKAMGRAENADILGLGDRVMAGIGGLATANAPKVAAAGAGIASKILGGSKARAAFALDKLQKWDTKATGAIKPPPSGPVKPAPPSPGGAAPVTPTAPPVWPFRPDPATMARDAELAKVPMTFDPSAHVAPATGGSGIGAVAPLGARTAEVKAILSGKPPVWPVKPAASAFDKPLTSAGQVGAARATAELGAPITGAKEGAISRAGEPGSLFTPPARDMFDRAPNLAAWTRKMGGLEPTSWQVNGLNGEIQGMGRYESGSSGYVKKGGMRMDEAVQAAIEDGLLPPGSSPADFQTALAEAHRLEKAGKFKPPAEPPYFDPNAPDSQPAGNLTPGQRILAADGDTYTVKGYNKNGQVVLKDGITLKLDPWEPVQGKILKKKKGAK